MLTLSLSLAHSKCLKVAKKVTVNRQETGASPRCRDLNTNL
jgi:hypothetical protein